MSDIRSLEGFREWEIDQMSARDAITSDEVWFPLFQVSALSMTSSS
jgi:hypothetical protein